VNLIMLEPAEVSGGGDVDVSGTRAAHLLRVLRVATGDDVRVGLVDGPRGIGTVRSTSDGLVSLRCVFEPAAPARPRVDLLLALPRPKVMRRLWAQLAALGVGRIMLTNAARVERNYFDTHVLSPDCYRPLLIEGLQQAQDTRLPDVSIHRQFKVLLEDDLDALCPEGIRLAADPSATEPVSETVGIHPPTRVLLAIGPEGGWNAFELSLLATHRFRPVGMGRRTLRTDTACVALLSLVHAMERNGRE
jgi:16S rRNA (uracil1498-N3)-methyltransferase